MFNYISEASTIASSRRDTTPVVFLASKTCSSSETQQKCKPTVNFTNIRSTDSTFGTFHNRSSLLMTSPRTQNLHETKIPHRYNTYTHPPRVKHASRAKGFDLRDSRCTTIAIYTQLMNIYKPYLAKRGRRAVISRH